MFQFRCGDIGSDDEFVATGNTKQEAMNEALSHVKIENGIKDSESHRNLEENWNRK
jgi:predicted small metal-binding protein